FFPFFCQRLKNKKLLSLTPGYPGISTFAYFSNFILLIDSFASFHAFLSPSEIVIPVFLTSSHALNIISCRLYFVILVSSWVPLMLILYYISPYISTGILHKYNPIYLYILYMYPYS